MSTRVLEVHLEEVVEQSVGLSLVQSLLSALGGTAAYAPYRFVARTADDSGEESTVVASATFPLLRFLDQDALSEPPASSDVARRLEELDRDLVTAGWRQREALGRHWWSRTYQQAQ